LYTKELTPNPLKTKILLVAFIRKATFNINESTIHSALHFPINQSYFNLEILSSQILNNLTNQCKQFCVVFIDEMFFVVIKLFRVIDQRLQLVKHVHFDGFNIIILGDFYQAPLVKDKWMFKKPNYGLKL
jgi:hypothetical protein